MKRALIAGLKGQDGYYLSELLLKKGYEVHAMSRTNGYSTKFSDHFTLNENVKIHRCDYLSEKKILKILESVVPTEFYNLAAQSHVGQSFKNPLYTAEVTALGCTRFLECIKNFDSRIRFYQASSSEIFGKTKTQFQDERTPLNPVSPYGCAKAYAHFITTAYRKIYNLHASCGILYNHESPIRSPEFVTRKISKGIADILKGNLRKISLGNLDARKDWGHSKDYVEAMWLMLQQPYPDDYVISSGETHSIKELLNEAFSIIDLDWNDFVEHEPMLNRPTETSILCGDSSKARKELGWRPKYSWHALVREMIEFDLRLVGIDINNISHQKLKKAS